jgi:Flp pilus assembly protein TadG
MMYRELRHLSRRMPKGTERGSVTLWLVIFTIAAFVLLAFVVDGGQYMNARERAADIAEQAARAGIDQMPVSSIRSGQFTLTDAQACPAVDQFVTTYAKGTLSSSDLSGTSVSECNVLPGTPPTVQVTVQITVSPVIPVIFGSFTTGAKETATINCGTAVAQGVC